MDKDKMDKDKDKDKDTEPTCFVLNDACASPPPIGTKQAQTPTRSDTTRTKRKKQRWNMYRDLLVLKNNKIGSMIPNHF